MFLSIISLVVGVANLLMSLLLLVGANKVRLTASKSRNSNDMHKILYFVLFRKTERCVWSGLYSKYSAWF